jgi:hypothetical protein
MGTFEAFYSFNKYPRTHEEGKIKWTLYIGKETASIVKTSELGLIMKKGRREEEKKGRREEEKKGRSWDLYSHHVRCGKTRFSAEHLF